MSDSASIVYVVDDDVAVREGLNSLFRAVGYTTRCFACVDDFVACERTDQPACLVLDVRMPGRGGLEFQRDLRGRSDAIPIVFLTGHGDVPMSVRAMKEGAVEFLLKPFREQELLDAVETGIALDKARRDDVARAAEVIACYQALSDREREILRLVAAGYLNREIGEQFDLKEITIKIARAKAMKKMKAASLVELFQKLALLNKAGVALS